MYIIRTDGKDLYVPGDEECVIISGSFKEEIGASGSLEFGIPSINPFYDRLRQRSTEIQLYKDDVLLFNGEIREISEDFLKNKNIFAVGELSYFKDSNQGLRKFEGTREQIFQTLIESHNSQVEERKRFEAGAVGKNPSAVIKVISEYDDTYTVLSKLLDDTYFRVRHEGSRRYLDIVPLESYGVRSEQYIEFSENLIDYAMSTSSEDLATACIPLGQSLDNSPVEDTTAYTDIMTDDHSDWDTPDGNGFVIHGNYVFNQNAVENFGWIKKVVHFNVLSTREALITAAKNWLMQNQFEKFSYELTAFDLSTIDAQVDDYSVGDYIRCISDPHGMDAWLPVREREIDLLNLANNTLTVGAEGQKSLTQALTAQIDALAEEIPDRNEILKAAFKNALEMINANGTDGYLAIKTDDNDKAYGIDIYNAPSIEQATQMWRWNLNGLYHAKREDVGDAWEWQANAAITMDGAIVADAITTGTMLANRIQGGILTLGGLDNQNGTLKILNAQGQEIGRWDKDGIHATTGTFSGSITAADGSGTMNYSGGDVSIVSTKNEGAGIFARDAAGTRYAAWGATNMAALLNGSYLETTTYNVVNAGTNISDRKLKRNIKDLSVEVSKNLIDGLRPRSFYFKSEPYGPRQCFGLIAQEVQKLYDEIGLDKDKSDLVHDNGDLDYLSVNYINLIAPLINYVRDLQRQINELKGVEG